MGAMECYEHDFEDFMLKDTAQYYQRKAAVWIQVRGPLGGGGRELGCVYTRRAAR